MPELDAILSPTRERIDAPFPLILEGKVATYNGLKFLQTQTAALQGPIVGAEGVSDGTTATVAISQEGVPYLIAPLTKGSQTVSGVWTWTTAATPASGRVTVNGATWAAATAVYIAKVSTDNRDMTNVLRAIKAGDGLYLQDSGDSTKWGRFDVTAAGLDLGDYYSFPVTYHASAGALPANNRATTVAAFVPGTDTTLLEQRISALETRVTTLETSLANSRPAEVYQLASTGDTNTLGSAYQDMPGLTKTLALTIGDVVLLDAAVRMTWPNNSSSPGTFFTIIEPDALQTYRTPGNIIYLLGLTVTGSGGVVIPIADRWVCTKAGSHTFKVQCTNQGTGGGGVGVGGSGTSKMRVVRLSGRLL